MDPIFTFLMPILGLIMLPKMFVIVYLNVIIVLPLKLRFLLANVSNRSYFSILQPSASILVCNCYSNQCLMVKIKTRASYYFNKSILTQKHTRLNKMGWKWLDDFKAKHYKQKYSFFHELVKTGNVLFQTSEKWFVYFF